MQPYISEKMYVSGEHPKEYSPRSGDVNMEVGREFSMTHRHLLIAGMAVLGLAVLLLVFGTGAQAATPIDLNVETIDPGAGLTVNGVPVSGSQTLTLAEGDLVTFETTYNGVTYTDVVEIHYELNVSVHVYSNLSATPVTVNLDTDMGYTPYDIFVVSAPNTGMLDVTFNTPLQEVVGIIGLHINAPAAWTYMYAFTDSTVNSGQYTVIYGTLENNGELEIYTDNNYHSDLFNYIKGNYVYFDYWNSYDYDFQVQEIDAYYVELYDREVSIYRLHIQGSQFYVDDFDGYDHNAEMPNLTALNDDMIWFKTRNVTRYDFYPYWLIETTDGSYSYEFDNYDYGDYIFFETHMNNGFYWYNDDDYNEYAEFLGPYFEAESFDWYYYDDYLYIQFFLDDYMFEGDTGDGSDLYWRDQFVNQYGFSIDSSDQIFSPISVFRLESGDFYTEEYYDWYDTEFYLTDDQDLLFLSGSDYIDIDGYYDCYFYEGSNSHWVVEDDLNYYSETPYDSAIDITRADVYDDGRYVTVAANNTYANSAMYVAHRLKDAYGEQFTRVDLVYNGTDWVTPAPIDLGPGDHYFYIVAVQNDDVYGKVVEMSSYKPVYNQDQGTAYFSLQTAIDEANSGDTMVVTPAVFNENVVVDGKAINIVDSSFGIVGDVSIRNGGSLTIDPTWLNVTGNIYVDNGSELILIDTILRINGTFHGEFRIQVNETGYLNVTGNSEIRSGTGWFYRIFVFGYMEVVDSTITQIMYIQFYYANNNSYFDNSTVNNWMTYGLLVYGTSLFAENTTFSGGGTADIALYQDSHVVLLNCSFGAGDIDIFDTSTATVQWYLHLYVSEGGAPVAMTGVVVTDNQPAFISCNPTDATGWSSWNVMTQYVEADSGQVAFTPHNAYATGFVDYGHEPVLMDSSKYLVLNCYLETYVHNVEQAIDYTGIQPAVMYANPGEHLEVYDVLQNETVVVDKALTITGVNAVRPVVNGAGIGPCFDIRAEGVEAAGLNFTNTAAQPGIYASAGGFNVHHNDFWAAEYAVEVEIYGFGSGSTTIGDMRFQYNEVNCDRGYRVRRIHFENPQASVAISVGQTIVTDNNITANVGSGIYLNNYDVENMVGGSISYGDITVTNNYVDAVSYGIWFWGYFGNLTDVTAMVGTLNVSSNNVTSGGNGLSLDYWEFYELYGTTRIATGPTLVNDNLVDASGIGIYLYYDSVGDEMYDTAMVVLGDIIVDPNNITAGNEGIYFDGTQMAYDMHNDTSFSMGNIVIDANMIDTSAGNDGIYFELADSAYNMYDNARATFGNYYVTNNNVTAMDEGIGFWWNTVGYEIYNDTYVSLGQVHIESNQIDAIGGGWMAIDAYPVDVGTYMYGNSYLTYGDWYVDDNNITSTGGGIYTGHEYCGYEMYDFARVDFHDYYVRNNVVDANNRGIYIGYYDCGESMYGDTIVTGGNFLVYNNTAHSDNSYGYYMYYDYMGYEMYDDSFASFGWYDTSYNNFSSDNSDGAYLEIYYLGAYMYGDSQAYLGDITFLYNEFWSGTSDAVLWYEFYENAYYMYDNSFFMLGDVLFNWNYLNAANGDGVDIDDWDDNGYNMYQSSGVIYGDFEFNNNTMVVGQTGINVDDWDGWGDTMYASSTFTMGHIQMNDNNITSGSYGIYHTLSEFANYMEGTSMFWMEDIEVLRNEINSTSDGIYIELDYFAYYMYDYSRAYFGSILFNENDINATNYGIMVDTWEYCAYEMDGNSYAEFGDIEFNNNTVDAGVGSAVGYDGIYLYFYENGYYMYGGSEAYFGHVQINDNTIRCFDDDGIYFYEFYDIGSEMYDSSYFEIGNVEVCRNQIPYADDTGIYIEYIYDLAYYNYNNSQAHFGSFLINENNITSDSDGIYADSLQYWGYELDDSADAYFGDVEFNNNTIAANGYGIDVEYFYEWGEYLYGANEVVIGHVQINDNDVTATSGDGIYVYYLYDLGVEMYQAATFTMGNFEICRNTVNASGDGIEMYEIDELAYCMYDNSEAYFGDFLFNDNDIIAGNRGFFNYYIEYLAYDMYDQAYAEFGNIEFNNNTIEAVNYGMYWEYGFYENAYYMEDSSYATMGHYQINDNYLNVSSGDGIYFYEWYDVGYEMMEDAYFQMGNLEVCRNEIIATGYGIYWEYFEDVAYYMGYDGFTEYLGFTTFIMGDILFNENIITSGSEGIYLYYFEYLGYEMYGGAYAEFGNFEVCNNTINATDDGIYLYDWYEWGYYMYDSSHAQFGSVLVNDNDIISFDVGFGYDGIYLYEWYDIGSEMYDQSQAHFGDFQMSRNNINSSGDGIWIGDIEDLAYYNYDSTVCTYGDFLWNENNIVAGWNDGGYGIYYDYFEDIAYDLYDSSDAYFGDIELNNNTIHSYDDGIYVYNEYWGYDLYGSNEVVFGHYQMNDNYCNSTNGNGIDMDYFYEIGVYMEQGSSFYMENFEICRNELYAWGGYDGIQVDIEYLGYDNDDAAWCHFGDFLFNDNVIISTSDGIYFDYFYYVAAYLNDNWPYIGNAYVEVGNFEVNNNTIRADGSGIYHSDFDYLGYEMYGESEARFGHFQFNDNDIVAGYNGSSQYGIYLYSLAYDMASYMYDQSVFSIGNIEICRNSVNSTGEGIYADYLAYYAGYEMYDTSNATFGDFLFNGNSILSGDDGIYFDYFSEVAAYMYDDTYFRMGDFEVNDNTIRANGANADGIYLDDFGYAGYEMYDNSMAIFGSVEISRNDIEAISTNDGYGIYMYPYDYGADLYNASYFEMGDWLFNDNIILADGQSDGMEIYFYEFAYEMYDYSQAYFGDCYFLRNTINTTGGDGIETWWGYEFAYDMYDYAYTEFGSFYLQDNDIKSWSSGDYGIYAGPYEYGAYVYDESQAWIGDYVVENNTVVAGGGDGVYLYFDEVAYDLTPSNLPEARSYVQFGDYLVNGNTVTSYGGDGIFLEAYGVSYTLEDYARSDIGLVQFNGNVITASGDAIHLSWYYYGYDLNDDSVTYHEGLEVTGNTLTSTGSNGLYIYIYNQLYDVWDDATYDTNDYVISNNDITARVAGIEIEIDDSWDFHDDCIAYVPGFLIEGNTVDPGFAGLVYNMTNSPSLIQPNVDVTWGNVWIRDNDFTSDTYGGYFSSDQTALKQPYIYVHNNDFVLNNTGTAGLYFENITDARVHFTTITGFDPAIIAWSSDVLVESCNFVQTEPFRLGWGADVQALDCTFDQNAVTFVDALSNLTVGWFMHVHVVTATGGHVPGADVTVDGNVTAPESGVTGPDGIWHNVVCWDYVENTSGRWNTTFNPYNVTGSKAGLTGWADPDATMNATKDVYVVLPDVTPPTILGPDNSDNIGYTGDGFYFEIGGVSDNLWVHSVVAYYSLNGVPAGTFSLTENGTVWNGTLALPLDSAGYMEYYFRATDRAALWVETGIVNITIIDNDAPNMTADLSDATATTGDNYTFAAQGTDNMAVTAIHVVYWYGSTNTTTNATLNTTTWDLVIVAPWNSTDTLHYYFSITDAAGNWFQGPQVDVNVTDDDLPVLDDNLTALFATTGDAFGFAANVSDNMGLVQVNAVVFWYGNVSTVNYPMTLTGGTYAVLITIPTDSDTDFDYWFEVQDVNGNWLNTTQTFIDVTDDDLPVENLDASDAFGTTGEAFYFNVNVTDNIGIVNVFVVIDWNNNGTTTNYTMSGTNPYYVNATIPAGSDAGFSYWFEAVDFAGNWYTGVQVVPVITDNDLPVQLSDTSPAEATTGEIYTSRPTSQTTWAR